MDSGFIKLHRKLLEWEWWDDHNVVRLFLYLLFKANWKPNKWRGFTINIGQLITSYSHLAEDTGLSIQQTRTALDKLKSTGEITIKTSNKNTLITVNNYKKYQVVDGDNKQDNNQVTIKQQSNNNQITTTEEGKEKKERKINIPFETFWEAYGKKVDKVKCETKWNKYLTNAKREKIMEHVPQYVASTPDLKYRKNPYTYLNSETWEDEIVAPATTTAEQVGGRRGLPPTFTPGAGTVEQQWEDYDKKQQRFKEAHG